MVCADSPKPACSKIASGCRFGACVLADPNVRARGALIHFKWRVSEGYATTETGGGGASSEAAEVVLLASPAKPNSSQQEGCEKAQLQAKETLCGKLHVPQSEGCSLNPAKLGLGEVQPSLSESIPKQVHIYIYVTSATECLCNAPFSQLDISFQSTADTSPRCPAAFGLHHFATGIPAKCARASSKDLNRKGAFFSPTRNEPSRELARPGWKQLPSAA